MLKEAIETRKHLPKNFNWNYDPHAAYPSYPLSEIMPDSLFPSLGQILQTKIDDEGPRDGLQGVKKFPTSSQMMQYVDLASEVGIDIITVGIATRRDAPPYRVTTELLQYMEKFYPYITPVFIIRPDKFDIGVAKDMLSLHPNTEILIYQAAAPLRVAVEGWTDTQVIHNICDTVDIFAKDHVATIATLEDATRTPPETIEKFVALSLDSGARRICYADTVGILDPRGALRFTKAIRSMIDRHTGGKDVGLDSHLHNDRGYTLMNMMAAVSGGADRMHGVLYGVGERSGNAPLELYMYNATQLAREAGYTGNMWHLDKILPLAQHYANITNVPIPQHAPLLGENIDRTGAGPHANAYREIEMALTELDPQDLRRAGLIQELIEAQNTIYTGVDLRDVGRKPSFYTGVMSGGASVIQTLRELGYLVDLSNKKHPIVEKLLAEAFTNWRALTPEEIDMAVNGSLPRQID